MERCPTCQARLRDPAFCARCKTDLAQAAAIETEARRLLGQAIDRLADNRSAEAGTILRKSLKLKREPLALALEGFLSRRLNQPTSPSGAAHGEG
ncbi:MAG: hypothetical protein ACKN9W_02455 [Methylococcus sp.]